MRTVSTRPAWARRRPSRPQVRRPGGRRQELAQACFTSLGVGFAVALSTLAGSSSGLLAGPSTGPGAPAAVPATDHDSRLWSASWSQRFPGCVATVLWPESERPVALVTRAPDGSVRRVEVGSARRVPIGDRVVGACR